MLFKLSLKNIKKSFKDYTIYFLTLVLGIAIFYMFNSIDAQEAMLNISASTKEIIKLMINMLSGISIFIAIILGFLIIYANNFLIKRRKKEFGIYITLGMSRRKVSQILLIETILVGIISLIIGLIVGIFGSQLMSVLVAKMFEANMEKFEFIFSSVAMMKTIIYFGIMYLAVLIFNTLAISRYKILDLILAARKNENIKVKNPIICIIMFLISISMLIYSYYIVTIRFESLIVESLFPLLKIIIIGCIGTFLFFWSLSGFILKLVQTNKKIYLKEMNMFVLRQINAKINTTLFSMTIICLMLFVTICVLSSAISINNSFTKSIKELTPVDINVIKSTNLSENSDFSARNALEKTNFNMNNFKDEIEITLYQTPSLTLKDTLGNNVDEELSKLSFLILDFPEEIIKISDYNKVAKLYGLQEYSVQDNEYIIICDYLNMKQIRNKSLEKNKKIIIEEKEYTSKYEECQEGFIFMAANHVNTGIIVVPDNCNLNKSMETSTCFIANYNYSSEKEKQEIENLIESKDFEEKILSLEKNDIYISINTKKLIYESSTGLSAMITFIALYLGIIFLIASSAILALKELSESLDNKQRYSILRKIGTDEKMIRKALFMQIGIFFLIPLALAIVHSIFGIQFALKILSTIIDNSESLIKPIIFTGMFIILIYGGYFVATYIGSKNVIKDDE